jgi:hypothetical protein
VAVKDEEEVSEKSGSHDGEHRGDEEEEKEEEEEEETDLEKYIINDDLALEEKTGVLKCDYEEDCRTNASALDDVVITDVTCGLVTVTIKECYTPEGFFKPRAGEAKIKDE